MSYSGCILANNDQNQKFNEASDGLQGAGNPAACPEKPTGVASADGSDSEDSDSSESN